MSQNRPPRKPSARLSMTFAVAALALSGCATLGGDACGDADWYALGLEDGRTGQSLDAMYAHLDRCQAAADDAAQDRYMAGRTAGLSNFCTTGNGLERAKQGERYAGVCPVDVEGDFLTGYRLGKQIHRVQVEMAKNRHEVGEIERALGTEDLASVERDGLRNNLHVLERDFGSLESRMERLTAKELDIQ